jgi:co-chaperonin GroES (HSP10)
MMKKLHPVQVTRAAIVEKAISTENVDIDPADDMLLLREVERSDQTDGGIVIPEAAREQMMPHWVVVAKGPGRVTTAGTLVPVRFEVGQKVWISGERGQVYPVPGRRDRHALVSESAILASVRDKVQPVDLQ